MKNIFSFEDAKRFYKKYKLTILLVTLATMAIYLLLSLYNYYSVVVEEEEELAEPAYSQEEIVEILNREPENILAEDLRLVQESLDAEAVEFRVYIESNDQDPLSDASLLKDFLTLDEVVQFVENNSNVEVPIDRDLAIVVNKRNSQPVLSVQIRVGEYEDNIALAEAYMEAFEENEIPLLQDREFYLLDNEAEPYQEKIINQILENMAVFSPISIIVGLFVSLLFGLILGVLLSIFKASRNGKVDELSILQETDSDTVLPFYRLSSSDKTHELLNAVMYPRNASKLVLSEIDLQESLRDKFIENRVDIVTDLSKTDPSKQYDEIVLLTHLDQTSKNWYENQRIQLRNRESEIKIIQL